MILVYLIRPGDKNDELRWSLRTVERNLDVTEVWTVGHQPAWLQGVRHIEGNGGPSKQVNVYDNLRLACAHPEIPGEVVVMNDDFFVLTPHEDLPMFWRSTLRAHITSLGRRNDWWSRSMRATRLWLDWQGYHDCLSYELHLPFPIETTKMGTVLAEAADYQPANPPQWRTLYGNRWEVGGTQAIDVKITRTGGVPTTPTGMLSTTDTAWARSAAGEYVRTLFPKPSRYERPT